MLSHHFLVSWEVSLANQRKLLFAQLVLNLDQLGKCPWTILKVVYGFQAVNTWNVAILEAKKNVSVVIFCIANILPNQ